MNFLLAFSAAIAVAVANFSLMNQNEKKFRGPSYSHFDRIRPLPWPINFPFWHLHNRSSTASPVGQQMQILFWPSWMPKCKIQSIWAIYQTVIERLSKVRVRIWFGIWVWIWIPECVGGIVFVTHSSLNHSKIFAVVVCVRQVNHDWQRVFPN